MLPDFFRSLFSLWSFVLARTTTHRPEPALLGLLEGFQSGAGDLLILMRFHAGNTYGANAFALVHDG